MTLETISGALRLFYIILVPLIVFGLALIAYSVQYWREKRREPLNEYDFIASFEEEEDDCFGEYPYDNECDTKTCHKECEHVIRCIMNTPQEGEDE